MIIIIKEEISLHVMKQSLYGYPVKAKIFLKKKQGGFETKKCFRFGIRL